jgi:leader peptidase (prepilin peptidase)/N-methyltransferase
LVEFGTGLIFAALAWHFMPILSYDQTTFVILLSLFSFIFSLLMVIAVYDIRHKIIPDKLVYVYAFVSFLSLFINHTGIGPLLVKPTLLYIASGPLFALPFALLWLLSRGRWMGLGDAKLMLGIGWMLGPALGLAAVTLSFWIGSIVSLLIMLFSHKKMSMKTEIPFAPFLIISTLIVFVLEIDMFTLVWLFHL